MSRSWNGFSWPSARRLGLPGRGAEWASLPLGARISTTPSAAPRRPPCRSPPPPLENPEIARVERWPESSLAGRGAKESTGLCPPPPQARRAGAAALLLVVGAPLVAMAGAATADGSFATAMVDEAAGARLAALPPGMRIASASRRGPQREAPLGARRAGRSAAALASDGGWETQGVTRGTNGSLRN